MFRYIVGNTAAGDPATAQAAPFVYIADPGDGSGIAQALALAATTSGSIFIRRGTYAYAGSAAMTVPANVRVLGEGPNTLVTSSADDNCIFLLNDGSELGNMSLTHIVGIAAKGTALVQALSPASYVHDIVLDLTATTSGGSLNAAVLFFGNATLRTPSRAERLVIKLPDGIGAGAVSTWMVGIRGATLEGNTHLVEIEDVYVNGGDVAILTLGIEMHVEALVAHGQSRVGVYASGPMSISGRQSIIDVTKGSALGGIFNVGSTMAVQGVRLVNTAAVSVPGIQYSSAQGISRGDIEGVEVGDAFSPGIVVGLAGEACEGVRVRGCSLRGAGAIVPVAVGSAAVNTVVAACTAVSTTVVPTDAGLRTVFDGNVWGAWLDGGTYLRSPLAAINADTDANAANVVGHPIVRFAPSATRDIDPRTALTSMAFTVVKTNAAAFGLRINVGADATWTTPGGAGVTYTLLNSAAAAAGSWLVQIDLPNKVVTVTPV